MRRLSFFLIISLITAISIWFLLMTRPQAEAKLASLAPLKVAAVKVDAKQIQPIETVIGRLQPIKTAQIRFEIAGTLVKRLVEPGMNVSQGDVLLTLQQGDYRDRFEQASSELTIEKKGGIRDKELLALAKRNLQLQEREEARLEGLARKNLIAQSQLDSTRQRVFDLKSEVSRLEYSVATSQARIRMKQAQNDTAKRNLERTKLVAAFDGIVNEVLVEEGDYINSNQVVLTLVDTSEYDVQVDVRGELIANLSLGQEIEVVIANKQKQGQIIAIQTDPDINTNTHQVRIRVTNDGIQSGALADVRLPMVLQDNAILVPVSAVLNNHGSSFVYVLENNVVKKTLVELGSRVDNEYIVTSGLSAGQAIVARDVSSLADEQQVIAVQ